jgi:hypothetical protein
VAILVTGIALLLTLSMLILPSAASAATRPELGAASPFAVVAGAGVTNQGLTGIAGDVGVGPGHDAGGLARERVNGSVHLGDQAWAEAHGHLSRALDASATTSCEAELTDDDLGGKVLGPGTTCVSSTARLSRTLTLDGRGDPDAVFVLKVPGSLTTEAGSAVVLVNGAQACNVVFRVGDTVDLGRDSTFNGTVLAERSIALGTSAAMAGRALSRGGSVSLDSNTVAVPLCASRAGAPTGPAPLSAAPAGPPTTADPLDPVGPPASDPSSPAGNGPSVMPGADPLLGAGAAPIGPGGGGDDTEAPPDASGFPADLAARRDSVARTGPSNSQPLIDVLAPLTTYGLTPEQIAQIGFGRFPVAGYASYTHDWWFPRFGPGWRLHEGTDIFAAAGSPVRSPTEGTVRLATGGLGGITVSVVEPNGTYYYLAHLAGRAPGLVEGAKVTTGQVVGFVGTSGNAKGTPPHVHFEVHPNGGGPVDPKPVLDNFLSDALASAPDLISAYATAPSAVVDGAAASAQLPLPSGPAATGPTGGAGSSPNGGVPTSTVFWAVLAGLAGLLVSRGRGQEVVVVAPTPSGAGGERVRLTVRSLYQRFVASPAQPGAGGGPSPKVDPDPVPPRQIPKSPGASPRSTPHRRDGGQARHLRPSEDPGVRVAEESLVTWATKGFGHSVPTAAPAVVDKVIGLRPLPPRHAHTVRALCLAPDPIQPLVMPSDRDRIYLTSAAVAALVTSGVPTLVCCATRPEAARLEDVGGFEILTGLPVLTVDQLFDKMAANGIRGFVDGTVVIVNEAMNVPTADLARLAGYLAESGGSMKLLLHRSHGPTGRGAHAAAALPAPHAQLSLPSSHAEGATYLPLPRLPPR